MRTEQALVRTNISRLTLSLEVSWANTVLPDIEIIARYSLSGGKYLVRPGVRTKHQENSLRVSVSVPVSTD